MVTQSSGPARCEGHCSLPIVVASTLYDRAISASPSPELRRSMASCRWWGVTLRGRPNLTPRSCARFLPSPVRARISSRSNSARPPRTVSISRPCGLVVSAHVPACGLAIWSLCHGRISGRNSIDLATGKSRGKREAIIPLFDGLRELLASIPKHSTTVLTNSSHRPWTSGALAQAVVRAKAGAGMADRDLHFHDLRGTAATYFYIAGLPVRVIAEILAWSEDQVEKIIRRYVARQAATRAAIVMLNEARQRT